MKKSLMYKTLSHYATMTIRDGEDDDDDEWLNTES